ncbi:MAG: hypothetical protein A4E30_00034 [Methanomassiliicoccales archaeon PtaB.Bin215]|nr:MAG: hypothetical protein A4E30_00034 [Methanomassiliicoccales archaeon PtaB.Bin215]
MRRTAANDNNLKTVPTIVSIDEEGPLIDLGRKYFEDPGCKTWKMYRLYEPYLLPHRERKVRVLELGVHTGASLMVWHEFFRDATIAGLDLQPLQRDLPDGVRFYQGGQEDLGLLTRISEEMAPEGWDIIIDDASHLASPTRASFWHLFTNHLRPGGLYFIEDWGTGYWDDWEDGSSYQERGSEDPRRYLSHDHGMVGFVKQLVDEAGRNAIHKTSALPSERRTMFDHMCITPGFVVVKKKRLGWD